ncbi:MAG: hypothetical protein IJX88_00520 [Clostridia bacterium]|nr:hypothetical protein [Clostridia bacterium]
MKKRIVSVCLAVLSLFGAAACGKKAGDSFSSSSVYTGPTVLSVSIDEEYDSAPAGMDKAQFIEWLAENGITLRVVYETHRAEETVSSGIITGFEAQTSGYAVTFTFGGKTYSKTFVYEYDSEESKELKQDFEVFFPEITGTLFVDSLKAEKFVALKSAYNATLAYEGDVTSNYFFKRIDMTKGVVTEKTVEQAETHNGETGEYVFQTYAVDGEEKTLTAAEKFFAASGNFYRYTYAEDKSGKLVGMYTQANQYAVKAGISTKTAREERISSFDFGGIFAANDASELITAYDVVYTEAKTSENALEATVTFTADELIVRETLSYRLATGSPYTMQEKIERRIQMQDGKISKISLRVGMLRNDGLYKGIEYEQVFSYTFDQKAFESLATLEPVGVKKEPYVKTLGFVFSNGATVYATAEFSDLPTSAYTVLDALSAKLLQDDTRDKYIVADQVALLDGKPLNWSETSVEEFMSFEKVKLLDRAIYCYYSHTKPVVVTETKVWQTSKHYEIVFGLSQNAETIGVVDFAYPEGGETGEAQYFVDYCSVAYVNGERFENWTGGYCVTNQKINFVEQRNVVSGYYLSLYGRYQYK